MTQKEYEPPSEFLKHLMGRFETPSDPDSDHEVLARLIELTRDQDPANRDWATLLLWQQGKDTLEVRTALVTAAEDENASVRAEAIRGLAELSPELALPFVRKALTSDFASAPIFEAAAIVANPSLVNDLRAFAEPSGDDYLDHLTRKALAACEAGTQS